MDFRRDAGRKQGPSQSDYFRRLWGPITQKEVKLYKAYRGGGYKLGRLGCMGEKGRRRKCSQVNVKKEFIWEELQQSRDQSFLVFRKRGGEGLLCFSFSMGGPLR